MAVCCTHWPLPRVQTVPCDENITGGIVGWLWIWVCACLMTLTLRMRVCRRMQDTVERDVGLSRTPLHGHRLRTPPTNTTNGRVHNNSTTCCTTNSPPTDKNLPHPSIWTCGDVGLWHCTTITSTLLWVCLSVGGVRSRCPCSGVWP